MDKKQFMEMMKKYMETEDGISGIPFDLLSVTEDNMPNPKETALKLKERLELFKIENDFKEGQLVSWKRGLKNRRYPKYDEPAIVVKILDKSVFSEEKESGSPYFLEPLDIILGVIINDDFEIFHYDKRRFIPFDDDVTTPYTENGKM